MGEGNGGHRRLALSPRARPSARLLLLSSRAQSCSAPSGEEETADARRGGGVSRQDAGEVLRWGGEGERERRARQGKAGQGGGALRQAPLRRRRAWRADGGRAEPRQVTRREGGRRRSRAGGGAPRAGNLFLSLLFFFFCSAPSTFFAGVDSRLFSRPAARLGEALQPQPRFARQVRRKFPFSLLFSREELKAGAFRDAPRLEAFNLLLWGGSFIGERAQRLRGGEGGLITDLPPPTSDE